MAESRSFEHPGRLLVVLPNWVGDVVLATPVLRALRGRFAGATITYLMRRYVGEIVQGCGWHDNELYWPGKHNGDPRGLRGVVSRLREAKIDLAILLTNSFRSALTVWLGRAGRRAGYARDGRTLLLTDRLRPDKSNGRYVPGPMLQYYAALVERVGCPVEDLGLELGVTPEQEARANELKAHYGFGEAQPRQSAAKDVSRSSANSKGTVSCGLRRPRGADATVAAQPYAVINPGAAFGAAKCWLPERFSQLCDRLAEECGLRPVVVGAAGESPLMREISRGASADVICIDDPGTTLGSLKPIVRDASLLVCNDTGPRHYGNAFGVPTVTIFGSTLQAWTDTEYAGETKLQIEVECGPCMLRTCPLDHRCMTGVTTDMVMGAVRSIMRPGRVPATDMKA